MLAKRYLFGCYLAKTLDFTSFAIVEMEWAPEIGNFVYHLVALDKIRGVDYPQITELIVTTFQRLLKEREVLDGIHLCLDASGLGAPIRDYLKQYRVARSIYPVVFTAGESARYDPDSHNYNISKTLIISSFLSLMQAPEV